MVAKDGTISLPLVGDIAVSGKRDVDVAEILRDRLAAQYLQAPQVLVSVVGYQGQRVAVIGAVRTPGFYEIEGQGETILDLITERRRGIAGSCRSEGVFRPRGRSKPQNSSPSCFRRGTRISARLSRGETPSRSISPDLYQGRAVAALGIPVRDGDLIAVQQGGEIFVGGWVEKPNLYRCNRQ